MVRPCKPCRNVSYLMFLFDFCLFNENLFFEIATHSLTHSLTGHRSSLLPHAMCRSSICYVKVNHIKSFIKVISRVQTTIRHGVIIWLLKYSKHVFVKNFFEIKHCVFHIIWSLLVFFTGWILLYSD